MTRKEVQARKQELEKQAAVARETARQLKTPEARQTAIDASAALSAFTMEFDPPKRSGYACRAGRRQAAERRALSQR